MIDDTDTLRGRAESNQDAVLHALEAVRAAIPDTTLIPSREAQLAGEPARRFDATIGEARLAEVVAVHDGRAYTVTMTGAPAGFGRAVEAFEAVLRSWRWD